MTIFDFKAKPKSNPNNQANPEERQLFCSKTVIIPSGSYELVETGLVIEANERSGNHRLCLHPTRSSELRGLVYQTVFLDLNTPVAVAIHNLSPTAKTIKKGDVLGTIRALECAPLTQEAEVSTDANTD